MPVSRALLARDVDVLQPARVARRHHASPPESRARDCDGRRLAWYHGRSRRGTAAAAGPDAIHWTGRLTANAFFTSARRPTKSPTFCATISDGDRGRYAAGRCRHDYAIWQGRYSPDGRWVLFNAQSLKQAGVSILGVVPAAGGKWIPLTDPDAVGGQGTLGARRQGDLLHFESRERLLRRVGHRVRPREGDHRRQGIPRHAVRQPRPDHLRQRRLGAGRRARRGSLLPIVESSGSIWVLEGIKK